MEQSVAMAQDNIEWSSDQMIENASNWSLAGDVALLNSLKKFSETLISDTESLNSKVDNLLNNLEHVGLKLELTKNEFQSLRNTQFIENRVYEDDETLEAEEQKIEEKEPTDEDKENAIKRAISNGLKVMEKYYDKVEVAVSDSEGESNEKNYVLQPKDPYSDRPLPYLVGTQDWYKKAHVGLLPSDSETESEKEEEEVYSSSSDSGEYLPKNRPLGSETSSELSFAIKNAGPVANSTFNDTEDRRREVFHSSSESLDQSSSVPVKTPISHENFAEQLAAKLGDVISAKHDSPVNSTLASRQTSSKPAKHGNLFSDEPPPLDDLEDTILPKSAHEGLFSVGRDLFAENNQEDLFSGLPQDKPNPNIQKPSQLPSTRSNKKMPKGLFDSSDSEEDMVTVTEKRRVLSNTGRNHYMLPSKATTVPFVDEQPPEIDTRKKPVGGVSVFGANVDIFGNKSTISQKHQDKKLPPTIKKASLFVESSDEEMFVEKSKIADKTDKESKWSLFDDSDDSTPKNIKTDDDVYPNLSRSKPTKEELTGKVQEVKNISLFDNEEGEETISKIEEKATSKRDSLFDDETVPKSTKPSIFDDATSTVGTKKSTKKISLFDDDDDFLKEEEDIFASVPRKRNLFDELGKSTTSKSTGSLFDEDILEESNKKHSLFYTEEKEIKKETQDKEIDVKKDHGSLFDVDILEGSKNKSSTLDKEVKVIEIKQQDKEMDVNKDTKSLFDEDIREESEKKSLLFDKEEEEIEKQNQEKESDVKKVSNSSFNNDILEESKSKTSLLDKEEKRIVMESANIEIDAKEAHISLFNEDLASDDEMFATPKETLKKNEEIEKSYLQDHESSHTSQTKKDSNIQDFKDTKTSSEVSESNPALVKMRNTVGLFDNDNNEKPFEEKNIFGDVPHIIKSEEEKLAKSEQSEPQPVPQNFSIPPPIDLFDPTPPPVDWDASSDNSGESDTFSLTDGILDRTYNQSQPSSNLFDEAPPSLDVHDMDYSSGIVRDLNVTRVETDDSSFYPYASSSRRLSSDIFNDQQSQDSFFVTKNRTENAQTSNLQKISETSDESVSKIENLTPSGNFDDFEGSSVFEKVSGDMNATDAIKKRPGKIDSFGSGDNEQRENETKSELPKIKTSPGKLKHNLNINVGALLPGAAPPKTRPIINKSTSLDETDKSKDVSPSEAKPIIRLTRPKSELFNGSRLSENCILHSEVAETKVLESVTKDRPRIQVKRRPSTRKARQESAKKSMEDFYSYTESILTKESLLAKLEQPNDTDNKNETLNSSHKESAEKSTIDFHSNTSRFSEESLSAKIDKNPDENDTLSSSNDLSKLISSDNSNIKNEISSSSIEPPQGISLVFDKNDNKNDLFDNSKDDLFGAMSRPTTTSLFDDQESEIFSTSLKKDKELKIDGSKSETSKDSLSDIFKSDKKLPGIFYEEDSPSDEDLFFNKPEKFSSTAQSSLTAKKLQDTKDRLFNPPKFEKLPASVTRENEDNKHQIHNNSSTSENLFPESVSTATKTTKNLFAKNSGDLFSPSDTSKATPEEKLPKKNIFLESDSDSDSELFGGISKADKKKVSGISKKKISLFDSGDSTDDDDLFGAKASQSGTSTDNKVAPIKKMEIKIANIKKLENSRKITDFDPLSGFQ